MSVLLNRGPLSQPAIKARLKIMVDQKRGKEEREIENRIAESAAGERIAIAAIDAHGVGDEDAAEAHRGSGIEPSAHADHEGQQAHGKKDQRVEQHLKA